MLAWVLNLNFGGSGVSSAGATVSGLMLLGVGLLRAMTVI